jgi:hypothetical protein
VVPVMTLAQGDFLAVGRKYRYVDVWEYRPEGWRAIYTAPNSTVLVLDDRDAQAELGMAKTHYFAYGRIFRLWTWTGTRWDLTSQI